MGMSWGYENIAGEAKKMKIDLGLGESVAWLVQGLCTDSILDKVEVQGFVIVAQVS